MDIIQEIKKRQEKISANTEQMFELNSANKENAKIEACLLVKGWIVRDERIIPEKIQY